MTDTTKNLDDENPVFIVGAKRGGTTLLRRVVDAHPDITIPPPGWLFHYVYPYIYGYGDLDDAGNFLELVSDCLAIPMIKDHWDLGVEAPELAAECVENSFRGVIHALTARYVAKVDGGGIWGSKAPGEAFWIREIHHEFPAARFIFLTRDGRDVATDLAETIWGPRSLHTAALNWRRHMEAILAARETLPETAYFDLSYEDFVRNPAEQLRSMCEFLNVEYAEEMVNHHQVSTDKFVTSSYHAKTNSPITDKYVGIYQDLAEDDLQAVIAACSDLLEHLNYGTGPARELSEWEHLRNADADDHGGMMLRGGVEFMEELRQRREAAYQSGRWTSEDRMAFLRRTA